MHTLDAYRLADRIAWCDRCRADTAVEVELVIVSRSNLLLDPDTPRYTGSVCMACDAVEVHR